MGKIERQIENENHSLGIASKKFFQGIEDAKKQGRYSETFSGNILLKTLFDPIAAKIEEYYNTSYNGKYEKDKNLLKLICDDSNEVSYVVLNTLISTIANSGNKSIMTVLSKSIMISLKKSYYLNNLKKNNPKLHSYLGSEFRRANKKRKNFLIQKAIKNLKNEEVEGNNATNVRLGSVLLRLVQEAVDDVIKVEKIYKNNKPLYVVGFTDSILYELYGAEENYLPRATFKPMIVKPKDWTGLRDGGYLSHQIDLIKANHKETKDWLQTQDISKILSPINKLQKTGWRVNKKVADIIKEIFENNMIDANSTEMIPRCYGGIPSPKKIDIQDLMPYKEQEENPTKIQKDEFYNWTRKRKKIQIALDGEKGRRLQFLLTLGLVDDMYEEKEFFYVYQFDYRGRVYAHTDFLNPQSKSYTKSMLEFSEGRMLNDTGLYWLKIHTANTFGNDKEILKERINWFEDNEDLILRVAGNPMENKKDWINCDSPYEFLASCFAYADYVSNRPVHLPIQLDAICSGTSFYSGLLLDKKGAEMTAIIPKYVDGIQIRPDLYNEVAKVANKKLLSGNYDKEITFTDKDGKTHIKSTIEEAKSIAGKLTRKMTKKNTMTVPYSVSMRGMQDQNKNWMEDMQLAGNEFWKGDFWVVNRIMTTAIHSSIYEIVEGARLGQEYLKNIARLQEKPAQWHTPLYNFPVMQPSFKDGVRLRVKTHIGSLTLYDKTNELNKQKQLSSIAANYIHSMDSTELLYTVDNMSSNIGVIHDCFLIHPNDGNEVTSVYKEGYIKIMESKPFELLSKELDPNRELEIPCIGDLDLNLVRESEYIIS